MNCLFKYLPIKHSVSKNMNAIYNFFFETECLIGNNLQRQFP